MYFSYAVVEFRVNAELRHSVLFNLLQETLSNGPGVEFGGEFTMVKLKETLHEQGLATYRTKSELIKRLSEKNSKAWEERKAILRLLLRQDDSCQFDTDCRGRDPRLYYRGHDQQLQDQARMMNYQTGAEL